MAILVIVLVVLLLVAGKTGIKVVKAIGWDMLLFHFIRGADFSGNHKTNATWLHNATWENNRNYAYISEWHHLAKLPRVAWRLGLALTLLLFAVACVRVHTEFFAVLAPFTLFALLSAALTVSHKTKGKSHERETLPPLVSVIAQELNVPLSKARKLLTLPKEALQLENGIIGIVDLPDSYTPSDSKRTSFGKLLSDHVSRDVEVEWQVAQKPRRAVIRIAGQPPEKVLLSEYEHYILHAGDGDIFLGVDRFRQPYYRNLNAGSDPHWAFSVRSGSGKSTFLGMTIVQILANDPESICVAIDPKGVSLSHLEGVPGFVYFSNHADVTEMWAGIGGFKEMLYERIEARKKDASLEFPAAVLMLDELPRFADLTADAWRELHPRGYASVWSDFRAILQMGREFNCHVIAMAQRLDDKSTGIQGTRSYFSFRGLSGYRDSDWSMLVGTTPVPPSQPGAGRWIYVADDVLTWVQNVTPDGGSRSEEAATMRAWADKHVSPRELLFRVEDTASRRETQALVSPSPTITGIAAGAEHLGMTRAAFRKAREERPVPGETRSTGGRPAWPEGALEAWQRSRPRAGRKLREGS